MIEDFEVRHAEIESKLRDIGRLMKGTLPPGYGFALLIFTYDKGSMFYISSAERDGMIEAMEEFIAKQRTN